MGVRERYRDLTAVHGDPLFVYCDACGLDFPYWTDATKPETCEICGEPLTEDDDDAQT